MAILYYNNATEDADWYNLNNWWTNEACTTQATSLPTSVDDVVVLDAAIYVDYGSENAYVPMIVNNFTSYGSSILDTINFSVLGVAKFYDYSSVNPKNETINGSLEFYDYSTSDGYTGENLVKFYDYSVANDGVENGIFYDNSNYAAGVGSSSGNTGLSFYNNSQNTSTAFIINCTFYDSSTYNPSSYDEYGGTNIRSASFNDDSICNGIVTYATFNDYSSNTKDQSTNGAWAFYDNSFNDANLTANYGISFNNNSYNLGSVIDPNGTYGIDFNDNSFNNGIASSPYNGVRYNGFTGTNSYGTFLSGGKPTTLYYFYETGSETEYWDITSWFYDENHSIPSQQFPSRIDSVVALSPILWNSTYPNITNLIIGNSSSNFFQPYIETIHYYNGYVTINGECSIGSCFFDGASSVSFNNNSSIMIDNGGYFSCYGSSLSFNDSSFINVSNGYVRNESGSINFNDNSFSTTVDPYLYAYEDIVFNGFTGTNSFGTFLNGKRQFYFNGAVDGDWQTLGNWWMDDAFTIQTTSLPISADDVIAIASVSNSGDMPTVANFTMNDPNGGAPYIDTTITVTGVAIFNGNCGIGGGAVYGNTVFNDYASLYSGAIYGNAIFNGQSFGFANIFGDATFNDGSYNISVIYGDAIFNNVSHNELQVLNNATFNDASFNDSYGIIEGDGIFNDSSYNAGTIQSNATFNHNSYLSANGSVTGTSTFNDASYMEPNNENYTNNPWTVVLGTRTPSPLRYGINNSNILGMI